MSAVTASMAKVAPQDAGAVRREGAFSTGQRKYDDGPSDGLSLTTEDEPGDFDPVLEDPRPFQPREVRGRPSPRGRAAGVPGGSKRRTTPAASVISELVRRFRARPPPLRRPRSRAALRARRRTDRSPCSRHASSTRAGDRARDWSAAGTGTAIRPRGRRRSPTRAWSPEKLSAPTTPCVPFFHTKNCRFPEESTET